jgi:two-component system sensor histidine kinase YesM
MGPAKLEEVRGLLAADHPHAEGFAGYGIHNVHERIQLSFGTRYGLSFESAEGCGTTVEVLHPLIPAEGPPGSPSRTVPRAEGSPREPEE